MIEYFNFLKNNNSQCPLKSVIKNCLKKNILKYGKK